MKKLQLNFVALTVLVLGTASFIGCSENENLEQKEQKEQLNLEARIPSDLIEVFKKSEDVAKLKLSCKDYIDGFKSHNYKKIVKAIEDSRTSYNNLLLEYGETDLNLIVDELIILDPFNEDIIPLGEHDGDPCTRNTNGTTYWGACTTWQAIKAYFTILVKCGYVTVEDLANEPTYENYANCNQEVICEKCGD